MTTRAIVIIAAASLLSACSRQPSNVAEQAPSVTPEPSSVVPASVDAVVGAARPAPPLLFIGLDGADWELLDDYIGRGVMPNLATLVREGTSGVLETDRPALSPLVWTTMMTGKSPIEHGVLDFVQFDPQTGGQEPITSATRRVPAIWNMATNAGKKTAVIGLWATFPAEPVSGVVVSDRLFSFQFNDAAPAANVVFPPDRDQWARTALAQAEQRVDFGVVHAYLPWLTEAEYRQHVDAPDPHAHPVSALRRILIETRVYDELGRSAFERDHPNVTVVYLGGTDSIGHVFAPYAAPRQAGIPVEDYERYREVPERYFRAIDALLGEYRALAERTHSVLMLASDHGFYWKKGRPEALSNHASATAAKWHRDLGMYLLWGAGVPASGGKGSHDRHGSVQQVCATLLALAGLPPGQGLLGAPLPGTPVATRLSPVDYLAFYHPVQAPPAVASVSARDKEIVKLKSLGYIADSTATGRGGETRTPGSYNNEGVILRQHGKSAEAIVAFDKALAADPNLASALSNLSDVLAGRPQTADRSDELLIRAYGNGLPGGAGILIARAAGYQRAGQMARGLKLISGGLDAKPDDVELWLFRGRSRADAKDCVGAVADFKRAETLAPANPTAYAADGLAQLCAGDRAAARTALSRSLELNPDQPNVRSVLKTLERTP